MTGLPSPAAPPVPASPWAGVIDRLLSQEARRLPQPELRKMRLSVGLALLLGVIAALFLPLAYLVNGQFDRTTVVQITACLVGKVDWTRRKTSSRI